MTSTMLIDMVRIQMRINRGSFNREETPAGHTHSYAPAEAAAAGGWSSDGERLR
jgi:hypothetical protein